VNSTRTYLALTGAERLPSAPATGAGVQVVPSSEVSTCELVGSTSFHWGVMRVTVVARPRSTVRLAVAAVGSGAQMVAALPSTAASAYIPGSSELACAGL
jgi:hypothetical protein